MLYITQRMIEKMDKAIKVIQKDKNQDPIYIEGALFFVTSEKNQENVMFLAEKQIEGTDYYLCQRAEVKCQF